jgi:hypothetical protein
MYTLVGGIPTPLKKKTVGIIIANIWKNKNVPNQQPDTSIHSYIYIYNYIYTYI